MTTDVLARRPSEPVELPFTRDWLEGIEQLKRDGKYEAWVASVGAAQAAVEAPK